MVRKIFKLHESNNEQSQNRGRGDNVGRVENLRRGRGGRGGRGRKGGQGQATDIVPNLSNEPPTTQIDTMALQQTM